MIGILWFLLFQIIGLLTAARFINVGKNEGTLTLIWIGSLSGSVLSAWLPMLFAVFFGFTVKAHIYAALLGTLAIAAFAVSFAKKPVNTELLINYPKITTKQSRIDKEKYYIFIIPALLFIFSSILMINHTLPINPRGELTTGQSTFGDMSMHLGFMTSIAVQGKFPPEYNILPGTRVNYPFLCDSISSSLYLLGTPLRTAYIIPCIFALFHTFLGATLLCKKLSSGRAMTINLAITLFFLNGGLGILYFLSGKYSFNELFYGFYVTPTNLTEENIRWVNIIADMLIPQRATLFGYPCVFAVLYLVSDKNIITDSKTRLLYAGVLAGAVPMLHTHSFLAAGLVSACWLLGLLLLKEWKKSLNMVMYYGIPAVLLAIPQLLIWTMGSVEGNEQFLRINIDWVNGGGENIFVFWFKNLGPMLILIPLAYYIKGQKSSYNAIIFLPCTIIAFLCEIMVFQPNVYDNNKLMYIGYLLGCVLVGDFITDLYAKYKNKTVKNAVLIILLIVCTNAAVFTLAREYISGGEKGNYVLFNADNVEAAEFIKENTSPQAVFLSDNNHNNTIAVLTGRNIVCGSPSYLYYHGVNYRDTEEAMKRMLADKVFFEKNKDEYSVDYVFIGSYELSMENSIYSHLKENYPLVFQNQSVKIYKVK